MPVLGAPATNNDADEATRTISGTTTPHGTPQSRQEVAIASLPERLSRAALIAQKREQPEDDKTQWQILSVKARYYIPVRPSPSVLPPSENSHKLVPLALQVLQWLPQYSLKKFAGDVIAALTMTSVIAPQAMSYATSLVHANPVSGLFGAAVPAMIYSVLGTCRQLSVGPEAALSLLTGDTVAKFLEEEEHAHGKMSEVDKAKFIAGVVTLITFQSGLVTFM